MATPCGDAPAYTGPAFDGRATSSIVVRGNTMYVGSTRAVRGESSVTGGTVTLAPGLPPYGLWKSTDGGANFTLLEAETVCLRSEEHTSELQSRLHLVCRLLLEKKKRVIGNMIHCVQAN